MRDINPDQRQNHLVYLSRFDQHAHVARKAFVTGGTTQRDAKHHLLPAAYCSNSNVIRVLHRSNRATTIEGDVKFTRQIVERAVVNNELREFLAKRQYVNEF